MKAIKIKDNWNPGTGMLKASFYTGANVVQIARGLLGKFLVTRIGNSITSGMITETEAYEGVTDRASHAFGGRLTERTEIMYRRGGIAYVYLCYGIHSLFNVVTNLEGIPHAVLIRSVLPAGGIREMIRRTGKSQLGKNAGTGPGRVSKLLGIHYRMSGITLTVPGSGNGEAVWIEDRGVKYNDDQILVTTRIGVDYAGEDAALPYRFLIRP